MNSAPVSVVTPFHNTAPYLAQCIESVLAQTLSEFEYVLVDNCSTDGSADIAEAYARRDPRIRFIRRSHLLSQVQNYNHALREISETSQYCKIVQADDFIFPECLRLMVQAFEQSPTIGLVSAYDMKGGLIRGSGLPESTTFLSGKEVARLYFRNHFFLFGSPTTVMYRSSLVRNEQHFYDESLIHEDTEKCMQILEKWDFGFVHKVLSFLRVDEGSISAAARTYEPIALDRYIIVRRFARVFLEDDEASAICDDTKRAYYSILAKSAIRFRERAFWQYHRDGLKTVGETLDRPYLATQVGRELLRLAANPGTTAVHSFRALKHKLHGTRTTSN